jgi:hypothetical protein
MTAGNAGGSAPLARACPKRLKFLNVARVAAGDLPLKVNHPFLDHPLPLPQLRLVGQAGGMFERLAQANIDQGETEELFRG